MICLFRTELPLHDLVDLWLAQDPVDLDQPATMREIVSDIGEVPHKQFDIEQHGPLHVLESRVNPAVRNNGPRHLWIEEGLV